MPWKETSVMDERMKFIGRILTGEKIAPLCKEFGISRVTGHKIWNRYQLEGGKGLCNRTRAPHRHPNQLPFEIEQLIIRLKKDKPSWGAPKIRELVRNKYPTINLPAISTVHNVLDRNGLTNSNNKRRSFKAVASYLSVPKNPNDLWCTDFKGQFRMKNQNYCFPLTISDFVSRYIISCEALEGTETNPCFSVFEEAFREYGLPYAIRSDNGNPFASGNSVWNLTRLSVWWIRLGIKIERIEPGNPQQNGRHERMHRTLKLETTNPSGSNMLQQQEKFDKFIQEFNFERPHQALNMKSPADVHTKSLRKYNGLPDVTYPEHDKSLLISNCGRICINRQKVHISKALANQPVGITEVENGIWQVGFMSYNLGFFDEECNNFAPIDDPFGFRIKHNIGSG